MFFRIYYSRSLTQSLKIVDQCFEYIIPNYRCGLIKRIEIRRQSLLHSRFYFLDFLFTELTVVIRQGNDGFVMILRNHHRQRNQCLVNRQGIEFLKGNVRVIVFLKVYFAEQGNQSGDRELILLSCVGKHCLKCRLSYEFRVFLIRKIRGIGNV